MTKVLCVLTAIPELQLQTDTLNAQIHSCTRKVKAEDSFAVQSQLCSEESCFCRHNQAHLRLLKSRLVLTSQAAFATANLLGFCHRKNDNKKQTNKQKRKEMSYGKVDFSAEKPSSPFGSFKRAAVTDYKIHVFTFKAVLAAARVYWAAANICD